jgi:hypothetical protein
MQMAQPKNDPRSTASRQACRGNMQVILTDYLYLFRFRTSLTIVEAASILSNKILLFIELER